MRILIDLQSCQSGSRLGGIGRYSLEFTKSFVKAASEHDVWILLNNHMAVSIADLRREFVDFLPQYKILSFECLPDVAEMFDGRFPMTKAAEVIREKFIRDLDPDAVIVTSLFEGLGDNVTTSVRTIGANYINAVILYDLIPLALKEKYLTNDALKGHYFRKIDSLLRSDILLAISEFSRDEGRIFLDFPPEKIINISSAIEDKFFRKEYSADEVKAVLGPLGITRKFILYTASSDLRKNQAGLIEAFGLLPAGVRGRYQLVLAGGMPDERRVELAEIQRKQGLSRSDVVFAGRIEDDVLNLLYNTCELFVFPSLCEGFGLPVLEAMRCGAAVIGSNTTSIPEVIGREDALFDPTSPRSISDKMRAVLTDRDFLVALRAHADVQSQRFSWERTATLALAALEGEHRERRASALAPMAAVSQRIDAIRAIADGLSSRRPRDAELKEIAAILATNELVIEAAQHAERFSGIGRLGVMSTWNAKCGIASYTAFMLSPYGDDVTVFAPRNQALIGADGDNVVRCWDIGSADFSDILAAVRREAVDVFLIQFNYGFGSVFAYAELIRALKAEGVTVFIELHATIDPPPEILVNRLVDMAEALRWCDGVLVHSVSDVERMAAIGVADNVVLAPLGVYREQPRPVPFQRRGDEFIVASYGFFLPGKGLFELIEAFAGLTVPGRETRLLMVNAEYPVAESARMIEQARQRVTQLGLGDRVTMVTDYLENSVSLGYLQQADLVVFPYQKTNESASAAVRSGVLSGSPVAVTPLDIFKDVAPAVHRLPGSGIDAIREGIAALAKAQGENAPEIAAVRAGRDCWVKAHDFIEVTRQFHSLAYLAQRMSTSFDQRQVFPADDQRLRTVIGDWTVRGLHSSGRAGVVLHGPYVTLPAGRYEVCGFGYAEDGPLSDAVTLRFMANVGDLEIPAVPVHDVHEQTSFCYQVDLGDLTRNFEVQVVAKAGRSVCIERIEIASRRRLH